MRRTKNFNEDLSKRLRNKKFAAKYLTSLIEGEDGLSLEEALKIFIEQMGIKEFASITHHSPSNIVDFIKGKRHPKNETLDSYLHPFGLKTVLHIEAA